MVNSIKEYEQKINNCNLCELCKTRKNVVPGNGNENAKIMVIGQAPGKTEDMLKKEFVGPAGQMLKFGLDIVGLNKDDMYFTNVIKCTTPQNKVPTPDQINKCLNYLRCQVMLIKPKIVILLGAVAFNTIFGFDKVFKDYRGCILDKKQIKYLVTYHPSAVLRDESKKEIFLDDLRKVKQLEKEEI